MTPKLTILTPDQYDQRLDAAYRGREQERPWYWTRLGIRPRAFRVPGEIVTTPGGAANVKLMAHELGHEHGHDHPSLLTVAGWLDVMSVIPLRVRDEHELRPMAAAWLAEVNRT